MKNRFAFLTLFTSLGLLLSCHSYLPSAEKKAAYHTQDTQVDEPVLPSSQKKEEGDFSHYLDSLEKAKQINLKNVSVKVESSSFKPVEIHLNQFALDQSKINSTELAMEGSGVQILVDQKSQASFSFYYGTDNSLYLNFLKDKDGKENVVSMSVPHTLSGLISFLQSFGVTLPSTSSSLSLATVIHVVTETLNSFQKVDLGYQLTVPSFEIKDTKVSSFALTFFATEGNTFCGLSTDPIVIQTKESNYTITLNSKDGDLKSNADITSPENFSDLTTANDSIFATLAKLCEDKYGKIQLDMNLKEKEKQFLFSGFLDLNTSQTFLDYSSGEYYLSLEMKNSGEALLNSFSLHYLGKTIYLDLNDAFKGYITDQSLQDIFSYLDAVVEEETNEKKYEQVFSSFGDLINRSLISSSALSVQKGVDDFTLDSCVTSFTYHPLESYEIHLDFSSFAKDMNDIVVYLDFESENKKENQFKDIRIQNLKVNDFSMEEIKFTFASSSKAEFEEKMKTVQETEKSYVSYTPAVSLFQNLCDLIEKKKAKGNLNLTFQDNTNNAVYQANLLLQADMSYLQYDSKTNLKNNTELLSYYGKGKYSVDLSMNVKQEEKIEGKVTPHSLTHLAEIDYQNQNVYLSYRYDDVSNDYIFRNYFEDAAISKILNLLDDQSTTASNGESIELTETLMDLTKLLSVMKESENYQSLKNHLQEGSLKDLSSFVSLDGDGTNLELTLNPDYLFQGTVFQNRLNALSLTLKPNGELISVSGSSSFLMNQKKSAYSFSLDISDDVNLEDLPTDEKILKDLNYQKINKATELASAVSALPGIFENPFGLTLDASLDYYDKDTLKNSITIGKSAEGKSSSFRIDPKASDGANMEGHIYVTHDSLFNEGKRANQNFSFQYNAPGYKDTISAEYNDHMRMTLGKKDITGEKDSLLSQFDKMSEYNLLRRYIRKLNTTDTSLPILDVIEYKDPARLLRYPYIKKVDFSDTEVKVVVSRRLFDASDESGYDTLTFAYTTEAGKDPKITSAAIEGEYQSLKNVKVTLSLANYDEVESVTFNESANVLDMSGIKVLTDCLIDTTERNYYEFQNSNLKLGLSLFSYEATSVTIGLYGQVYVADNHAYAYMRFVYGSNEDSSMSKDDFHVTEVFVMEEDIWISETDKTTKTSGTIFNRKTTRTVENKSYKITREELFKNFAYYFLQVICHLDEVTIRVVININAGKQALNKIYSSSGESSSSVSLSDDLSQVISSVSYGDGSFKMSLNLNQLISISACEFSDTDIAVHYNTDSDDNYFKFLVINAKIKAISILSISINQFTLNLSAESLSRNVEDVVKANGKMNRFYTFVDAFETYECQNNGLYTSMKGDLLHAAHVDPSDTLGFYTVNPTSADNIGESGANTYRKETLDYSVYASSPASYPFFYQG